MGALPPYPRDLSLLEPEWMFLFLPAGRPCRTIETLDRRTGQRRDAPRAPIQVRNGGRSSGRLLFNPLHHLSNAEILSRLWGPPH
jgi:hypothetical protein